jgi:hypothetical protein
MIGRSPRQQMRYVIAVAQTRNFTRAAEQCFVVQSALSHRIAGLERELGVKLFARTSRRVQLTAAGAASCRLRDSHSRLPTAPPPRLPRPWARCAGDWRWA